MSDERGRCRDARRQLLVAASREQRVHRSVVVDVRVGVDQPGTRLRVGAPDRCDGREVATFRDVRDGLERQHAAYCRAVPRHRTIGSLQRANATCRLCAEAGHPIVPAPVLAGHLGSGRTPGSRASSEGVTPWQGRAGWRCDGSSTGRPLRDSTAHRNALLPRAGSERTRRPAGLACRAKSLLDLGAEELACSIPTRRDGEEPPPAAAGIDASRMPGRATLRGAIAIAAAPPAQAALPASRRTGHASGRRSPTRRELERAQPDPR
jgi:hypothetical protein